MCVKGEIDRVGLSQIWIFSGSIHEVKEQNILLIFMNQGVLIFKQEGTLWDGRGRHDFSKGYIYCTKTECQGFEGRKWDACNLAYGEVAVTSNNQDERMAMCV